MKFKHCRVCKGKMTSRFSYCPQCGGYNPRVSPWSALLVMAALIFAVVRLSDGYAVSDAADDQYADGQALGVPSIEPHRN